MLPYVPLHTQNSTLIFCVVCARSYKNVFLFVRIYLIIHRYTKAETVGFRVQLGSRYEDWPCSVIWVMKVKDSNEVKNSECWKNGRIIGPSRAAGLLELAFWRESIQKIQSIG